MALGYTKPLVEMCAMNLSAVKGGKRVRLTSSSSVSRLPRKCGSLHGLLQGRIYFYERETEAATQMDVYKDGRCPFAITLAA
jgi:hypothetical protein